MIRIRCRQGIPNVITFTVKDADGDDVPASALTVAELTLYDLETHLGETSPATGIINGRNNQDVLNAHGVTFEDGRGTWQVSAEDNPIVNTRRQLEIHRARLEMTWAMGSPAVQGAAVEVFELQVENLRIEA